jgi:hypothetical protein
MNAAKMEGVPNPTEELGKIEFGPRDLEFVHLNDINEIEQVRKVYSDEGIEDLVSAILRGNVDEFGDIKDYDELSTRLNLNNPLIVARLDPQALENYLKDHADYYGYNPDEQSERHDITVSNGSESTLVLIAGHRRKRAISRISERYGLPLEDVVISAAVHDNITFDGAISLQLRENVYERPSPQEEAKAIELYYRHECLRHPDEPITVRRIAHQLGFSESKVSSALAFASLPRSIQDFTSHNILSYSVVCKLKPLHDSYGLLYERKIDAGQQPDELKEDWCENMTYIFANRLASSRLAPGSEKMDDAIRAMTGSIRGEAAYHNGELFVVEDYRDTSEALRKRSERTLAARALGILQYQLKVGAIEELDDDMAEQLRAILDRHDRTEPEEPPQPTLMAV